MSDKHFAKYVKFDMVDNYYLGRNGIIRIRVSDVGDFENDNNYTEFEFDYKTKEYYRVGGRDFTELEQVFVTGFVARYEDILIKFPHALGKLTVVPADEDIDDE